MKYRQRGKSGRQDRNKWYQLKLLQEAEEWLDNRIKWLDTIKALPDREWKEGEIRGLSMKEMSLPYAVGEKMAAEMVVDLQRAKCGMIMHRKPIADVEDNWDIPTYKREIEGHQDENGQWYGTITLEEQ